MVKIPQSILIYTIRFVSVLWFCICLPFLVEVVFCAGDNPDKVESRNARVSEPWATIRLKLVSGGFNMPSYVASPGDRSNRLFVVEKGGRIMIIKERRPISDPFFGYLFQGQFQRNRTWFI